MKREIGMEVGKFYYIKDKYYIDFPDKRLMKNKENSKEGDGRRPFFCALKEGNIYWVVPLSSKAEKYGAIHDKKFHDHGYCDTIYMGNVHNKNSAFLIQNMCPATDEYIEDVYTDLLFGDPVTIPNNQEREICNNVGKILALIRKGYNLVFPNSLKIYRILKSQNQ